MRAGASIAARGLSWGLVAVGLAVHLGGCSANRSSDGWAPVGGPAPVTKAEDADRIARKKAQEHFAESPAMGLARLRQIYDARTRAGGEWDYPIGTGDLIEISVPSMQELEDETMRVSSSGTVSLPMLGDIRASGLTEKQFKAELRRKLSRYMHDPRVSVSVTEYRSRQVGVIGAVEDPGLHNAGSADSTILDMISEAGGLTDDATQRLLFIPAEDDADGDDAANNLTLDGLISNDRDSSGVAGLEGDPLLKAADPIIIDLEKMNRRSARFALAVPVRPGDTIMALGGGQIYVQGWVEEPGSQKMTRGLTLLGAIAAAGGASFPAKKSTVQILREGEVAGSARVAKVVDLEEIEEGKLEDIPLREGDLVVVEAQGVKLVGYGLYQFFSNVMRVGLSVASPF